MMLQFYMCFYVKKTSFMKLCNWCFSHSGRVCEVVVFLFFVLHTAPSSFVLTHHFVKISSVVINIGIILPFLCDFAGRVK